MNDELNTISSQVTNNKSVVYEKSYAFSLIVINIYKILTVEKKEYVLSKQLLRSGTSIGANVNEAISGVSKKDFINKLGIALKEARETIYWLNLLKDSKYLEQEAFSKANKFCQEIIKILSSIILTTKERYLT